MSSLDADVRIVLNAEDRASGTVDVAAKRINTSYRDMRRQQNALGQSFELNHRTISQSLRGIQAFGNAANRLIGVYQAWNIQQIRNSQTSKDLKAAQDELNDAILEYGINSDQAKEAQEKVNALQDEAKQNAIATAANYVLIGTSVAGMATSMIRKGIPALTRMKTAIMGVNAALVSTAGAAAGLVAITTAGVDMSVEALTGKSPIKSLAAQYGIDIPSPAEAIRGVFGDNKKYVGILDQINPSGGEYSSYGKTPQTGAEQLGQIGTQVFNFFSSTSQELVDQVAKAAKQAAN